MARLNRVAIYQCHGSSLIGSYSPFTATSPINASFCAFSRPQSCQWIIHWQDISTAGLGVDFSRMWVYHTWGSPETVGGCPPLRVRFFFVFLFVLFFADLSSYTGRRTCTMDWHERSIFPAIFFSFLFQVPSTTLTCKSLLFSDVFLSNDWLGQRFTTTYHVNCCMIYGAHILSAGAQWEYIHIYRSLRGPPPDHGMHAVALSTFACTSTKKFTPRRP